jgi:hypothetical protein
VLSAEGVKKRCGSRQETENVVNSEFTGGTENTLERIVCSDIMVKLSGQGSDIKITNTDSEKITAQNNKIHFNTREY